jgi:hypothetical protein
MAFLPWGKIDVGTDELPPKEATHMSRDLKYIGMDVHKEAVVIAVRNSNGQLVMESIVETKASSLLQFIHGLQGELHVTWEEGTWAAWLYDLLKPHVHEVLVCNPRRNALDALSYALLKKKVNYVLDADIQGFLDSSSHCSYG